MHKKIWIATDDRILVDLRDYQDEKADVILKYMPNEARLLKTYDELSENTRLHEGIVDDEEDESGVDDYVEFEDEDINKIYGYCGCIHVFKWYNIDVFVFNFSYNHCLDPPVASLGQNQVGRRTPWNHYPSTIHLCQAIRHIVSLAQNMRKRNVPLTAQELVNMINQQDTPANVRGIRHAQDHGHSCESDKHILQSTIDSPSTSNTERPLPKNAEEA
ncbi:hypothetical protein V6N13_004424 [Hibiscus sabdariffa]